MSAIYDAHPSDCESIDQQLIQLQAQKKSLSVQIRRLQNMKKQREQERRDAQMQKKINEVRAVLPNIPKLPLVYRRTADTQQRRCEALRSMMIDEGLLSKDDTPCDVCILAGPELAAACTSDPCECCSYCLETDDICFYRGSLPMEHRVETLKDLYEDLDRISAALKHTFAKKLPLAEISARLAAMNVTP